jgi:hypothetical protein
LQPVTTNAQISSYRPSASLQQSLGRQIESQPQSRFATISSGRASSGAFQRFLSGSIACFREDHFFRDGPDMQHESANDYNSDHGIRRLNPEYSSEIASFQLYR